MMIHRNIKNREARKASLLRDVEQARQGNESSYTKTDINRMSKDDLVVLANGFGFENAEEANGVELKKFLIEHFDL